MRIWGLLILAGVGLTPAVARAGWGCCGQSHPLWKMLTNHHCQIQHCCMPHGCHLEKSFWSRRPKVDPCSDEARLEKFMHDYSEAMQNYQTYMQLVGNMDWEIYYKSQGCANAQGCANGAPWGTSAVPGGYPGGAWHHYARSPRDYFMDP
jgi:hypothetical protein